MLLLVSVLLEIEVGLELWELCWGLINIFLNFSNEIMISISVFRISLVADDVWILVSNPFAIPISIDLAVPHFINIKIRL